MRGTIAALLTWLWNLSPVVARGLILGLPLAAARARGPVLVEEAPEPVVCRHGPECDAKWRRAREWVGMHSRWPIREDTDALIDDRRRAPPPSAGIWHHAASESGKLTSIEHCVHLVHER